MVTSRQGSPRGKARGSAHKSCKMRVQDKVAVLDWMQKNRATQVAAALHFKTLYPGITQPFISSLVKQEASLREWADDPSVQNRFRLERDVKVPELEERLGLWINKIIDDGKLRLTGQLIIAQAQKILDNLDVPQDQRPKFSSGWLTRFKTRHGLKFTKLHGEAGSVGFVDVASEQARLKTLLRDWSPKDVFNMDETASFYKMIPDKALMRANASQSGLKADKMRITLGFCVNADGSEALESIIIARAAMPRCFNRSTAQVLGYKHYYHNKTAWMTLAIFTHRIRKWDGQLRAQDRKILLLVDNLSGHNIDKTGLTNIQLEFFKANSTSHVQPLDAGIIRCFKAKFRAKAWGQITKTTISNCWHDTKILPDNAQAALELDDEGGRADVEDGEEDALGEVAAEERAAGDMLTRLYDSNAVPVRSRITLHELLNPVEEQNPHIASLRPQAEDVGLAREVDIGTDIEQDASPEGEEEEPEEVVVAPTPREALKMALGLVDFANAQVDDCRSDLRRLLGTIKHKIHLLLQDTLKQTTLNAFFSAESEAGCNDATATVVQASIGDEDDDEVVLVQDDQQVPTPEEMCTAGLRSGSIIDGADTMVSSMTRNKTIIRSTSSDLASQVCTMSGRRGWGVMPLSSPTLSSIARRARGRWWRVALVVLVLWRWWWAAGW